MAQMPGMATTPAAGALPAQTPDGMQGMPGMTMPGAAQAPAKPEHEMPGMNVPGMEMSAQAVPEPPVAPAPAAALQGPENAADAVYGGAAMLPSRTFLLGDEHGGMTASRLMLDQLETRVRSGRNGYFVNGQAWYGGDINKFWVKTELEGDYGRNVERAEVQMLWSHAVNPWFNLHTGVRLDAEPRTRGRFVLGIEGLAPYWWEVNGAIFVSQKGDVTARAEADHDIRIAQRLILQPRGELDMALQDIPRERTGAGVSRIEAGARLRYQIVPNFAPYVGLVYDRALGRSARFMRANGDNPGGLQLTLGVRASF